MSLNDICDALLTRDAQGEAIEYEGRWYSWGEVQRMVGAVRDALEQSGAGAGASVSLVARNRPNALAAFLALLAEQRTVRMIYAFQKPAALAKTVERLDSPVLVMDVDDFSADVVTLLQERGMAGICLDGMEARLHPDARSARPRAVPQGEPRVEVLTSGTTGPPKHFPIPYSVIAQYARRQNVTLRDTEASGPPFLFSFPVGNISGLYSFAASLMNGMRVELLDRFTVEKWRKYIVRYRPTHAGGPPAAVAMILDSEIPQADLASLESFSTGAAPLDPMIQKRFEDRYGIPIVMSYGATEFGGPVIAMTADLRREFGDGKFTSVGRAMPGVKLRLRDPATGDVVDAPGEGLLEVVSPRIGENWIATSDLARIDEDGFVYCLGRSDGAIMRGGFKILPETVETALMLDPSITAACVVGVADPRLHEVPAVAIQLARGHGPLDPVRLETHLREHLPAPYIPVHWKAVEELPKTVSFKIDRPAVRRLFAA